jgi:DNA integrity scanning protein DisA with diadenylate cyclase activity
LNQCKEAISNLSDESKIEKESVKKIIGYISNEVNEFEKSINKKDEEFQNYTYKMLKRLFNKLQEEAQ